MSFQSMSQQRKLILIFSAIGVISVFLPWITITIFGETESVNGFRGAGIVVFLAFAAGIVIAITGNQNMKLDRVMWLAALAAGIIALLFVIISFGNTSEGGMGLIEPGHGFGIWLALVCSVGILGIAWFLKNPGDNIRASIDGIKQNKFVTNSSTPHSKVGELERLIELKNQGKISEEEYQEMKSKII